MDAYGLPSLAAGESGDDTQVMSIVGGPRPAVATLAAVARQRIQRALEVTAGNKSRAARILGIERNTLAAKMKRHGFEAAEAP